MLLLLRHKKLWTIALCFLTGFILMLGDVTVAFAEQTPSTPANSTRKSTKRLNCSSMKNP
jgi:hypothetical protein